MQTLDVKSIGLPEGVPGHTISARGERKKPYSNGLERLLVSVSCSCGGKFHDHWATDRGKASGYQIRAIVNHLELHEAGDIIYPIGKVTKQRTTWEVFVFPRTYSGAADWAEHRFPQWSDDATNWYSQYGWAVGVKKPKTKRIEYLARSKAQAIDNARRLIDQQLNRGHTVEYYDDTYSPTNPIPLAPQTGIIYILDNIDAALDSGKVDELDKMINEVDSVLSIVDILKDRREKLVAVREEVLTRKLTV